MRCLSGCLALSLPRLILLGLWLFTQYLNRAFESNLWLFLGFLFLPMTTLAYAWAKNTHGEVSGGYLAVVIVALVLDLGLVRFGGWRRERRHDDGSPRDGGTGTQREITVKGERVG